MTATTGCNTLAPATPNSLKKIDEYAFRNASSQNRSKTTDNNTNDLSGLTPSQRNQYLKGHKLADYLKNNFKQSQIVKDGPSSHMRPSAQHSAYDSINSHPGGTSVL